MVIPYEFYETVSLISNEMTTHVKSSSFFFIKDHCLDGVQDSKHDVTKFHSLLGYGDKVCPVSLNYLARY